MKNRHPLLALLLLVGSSASAQEVPLDRDVARALLRAEFKKARAILRDEGTIARMDKFQAQTERSFDSMSKKSPVYPFDIRYLEASLQRVIVPRLLKTTDILNHKPPYKDEQDRLERLETNSLNEAERMEQKFFTNPANAAALAAANARAPTGARDNGVILNFRLYSPVAGAALDGAQVAYGENADSSGSGLALGLQAGAAAMGSIKQGAPAQLDQAMQKLKNPPGAETNVKGIAAETLPVKVTPSPAAIKQPTADDVLNEPIPPSPWIPVLRRVNRDLPAAYSEQSGVALQEGRYSDAARMAKTALRFEPKNKNALFVVASAQGRVDAADAASASRAAASAGMPPEKPADAGFASVGSAKPAAGVAPGGAAATAAVASSARVTPATTREALVVAKTALRLGDGETALAQLDKALLKDPESVELLGLRAQTYGRLGRWEEALKDADRALTIMPGNMPLLTTKSISENRTGRWRDALATSERMIAADPRNAWGYAARAHAWGGLGNRDAMISDINRAASLDRAFKPAANKAAALQLPTGSDMLFLFPGEMGSEEAAPAAPPVDRSRGFGVVLGASIAGGLLLALGLLSIVLPPLKAAATSVFTRTERQGPAVGAVPEAAPAPVHPLIRGQYQVSRQIGQGGMGTVFEGVDRNLGRKVAIKKMREELRVNARERDRFVIEAKTVASLHHPHIVDIYAIAEEGDDVYLIFEFVDGRTVHDLVQQSGRLGLPEAVSVTRSMGEALTYAHSRGVIHRDMKPSNVMLSNSGVIKVMDFGIARMAKDAATRYSMTNTIVGTPPYMAPEQEQGVVRRESDVYALAICAYEMLTGKLPFIGMGAGMLMNKINMSYVAPSRAIAGLPEALDGVFLKAFQADPDQRYRAPADFVTALSTAANGARSKSA